MKEHKVVDLYHARNGNYFGSFGEGIIESVQEITASKDGRVMELNSDQSCHLFNVDGLHLANFSVNIQGDRYFCIACHPVGEHVKVAGEERETYLLIVAIYTVNGDFERKIQLNETLSHNFFGTQSPALTVSQRGHITVTFEVKCGGRVIVLKTIALLEETTYPGSGWGYKCQLSVNSTGSRP